MNPIHILLGCELSHFEIVQSVGVIITVKFMVYFLKKIIFLVFHTSGLDTFVNGGFKMRSLACFEISRLATTNYNQYKIKGDEIVSLYSTS